MTPSPRHTELEEEFRDLLHAADLPQPDEVGHFRRAVAFLWYASKAFVLVDLDEVPRRGPAFEGLDLDALEDDILGPPPLIDARDRFLAGEGFAETG
jgi:hypothetical protein